MASSRTPPSARTTAATSTTGSRATRCCRARATNRSSIRKTPRESSTVRRLVRCQRCRWPSSTASWPSQRRLPRELDSREADMRLLAFLFAALAFVQPPAPPPPAPLVVPEPAILRSYRSMTADRLKNPDAGDWPMVRRTYDGWGYSPLDQITPANVSRLQPAWVFSTGVANGHEAPPIVNNGVMFVATPGDQVIALDAQTGAPLWRYKRTVAEDVINLHPTSRGVALYGGKVFFAA